LTWRSARLRCPRRSGSNADAIDREHATTASPEAKAIKLDDLIGNTRSIVARDPTFAKVSLAEKRLLLGVLREGDAAQWKTGNELAPQAV
jgi:hypothetical protein